MSSKGYFTRYHWFLELLHVIRRTGWFWVMRTVTRSLFFACGLCWPLTPLCVRCLCNYYLVSRTGSHVLQRISGGHRSLRHHESGEACLFDIFIFLCVQSGCCIIQYTSTRVCLVRKVHGRSIFYCCCNSVEKLYRNAELDPGVEAAGTS